MVERSDAHVVVARARDVVILIWKGTPNLDAVETCGGVLARVASEGQGVGMLVIVEESSTSMSDAVRKRIGAIMKELGTEVKGVSVFIAQGGLAGTAFRFFLNVLSVTTASPQRASSTLNEAITWLMDRLARPEPIHAVELTAAVSSLRAQRP